MPDGLNLLISLSDGPSSIIEGRLRVALKLLWLFALDADIDRLREMDLFELPYRLAFLPLLLISLGSTKPSRPDV